MKIFKIVALACAPRDGPTLLLGETVVSGSMVVDGTPSSNLLRSGQWCFGKMCLSRQKWVRSPAPLRLEPTRLRSPMSSRARCSPFPGVIVGQRSFFVEHVHRSGRFGHHRVGFPESLLRGSRDVPPRPILVPSGTCTVVSGLNVWAQAPSHFANGYSIRPWALLGGWGSRPLSASRHALYVRSDSSSPSQAILCTRGRGRCRVFKLATSGGWLRWRGCSGDDLWLNRAGRKRPSLQGRETIGSPFSISVPGGGVGPQGTSGGHGSNGSHWSPKGIPGYRVLPELPVRPVLPDPAGATGATGATGPQGPAGTGGGSSPAGGPWCPHGQLLGSGHMCSDGHCDCFASRERGESLPPTASRTKNTCTAATENSIFAGMQSADNSKFIEILIASQTIQLPAQLTIPVGRYRQGKQHRVSRSPPALCCRQTDSSPQSTTRTLPTRTTW